MLSRALLASVLLSVGLHFFLSVNPVLDLVGKRILARDANKHGGTTEAPLKGYVAVITGATSGIGLELAGQLSTMGAKMVMVGRNQSKLERVAGHLRQLGGAVDTVVADFADLDSVAACGMVLAAKYPVVDLLVNNAGIHYMSDVMRPSKSLATVDGYDLAFSSNYLGHFLLTRFVEPALHRAPAGRLVQLSSSYHWHSGGTDIDPRLNGGVPLASVGDASQSTLRRRNMAYGSSKLAQILHARALQRSWPADTTTRAVSACPAWVATNITYEKVSLLIHPFAFKPSEGVSSALGAAFLPLPANQDFVANSNLAAIVCPDLHLAGKFATVTGLREVVLHGFAFLLLFGQRFTFGTHVMATSPESYDVGLQDALFEWSTKVTDQWVQVHSAQE